MEFSSDVEQISKRNFIKHNTKMDDSKHINITSDSNINERGKKFMVNTHYNNSPNCNQINNRSTKKNNFSNKKHENDEYNNRYFETEMLNFSSNPHFEFNPLYKNKLSEHIYNEIPSIDSSNYFNNDYYKTISTSKIQQSDFYHRKNNCRLISPTKVQQPPDSYYKNYSNQYRTTGQQSFTSNNSKNYEFISDKNNSSNIYDNKVRYISTSSDQAKYHDFFNKGCTEVIKSPVKPISHETYSKDNFNNNTSSEVDNFKGTYYITDDINLIQKELDNTSSYCSSVIKSVSLPQTQQPNKLYPINAEIAPRTQHLNSYHGGSINNSKQLDFQEYNPYYIDESITPSSQFNLSNSYYKHQNVLSHESNSLSNNNIRISPNSKTSYSYNSTIKSQPTEYQNYNIMNDTSHSYYNKTNNSFQSQIYNYNYPNTPIHSNIQNSFYSNDANSHTDLNNFSNNLGSNKIILNPRNELPYKSMSNMTSSNSTSSSSSQNLTSNNLICSKIKRHDILVDKINTEYLGDDLPNVKKIHQLSRAVHITVTENKSLHHSDTTSSHYKRERNRLASRICRLKKRVLLEKEKLIMYHLFQERSCMIAIMLDLCDDIDIFLTDQNHRSFNYSKTLENNYQNYCGHRVVGNYVDLVDRILRAHSMLKKIDYISWHNPIVV